MSSGHNNKGGLNMHFNHTDPTKVNVSSLSVRRDIMWGISVHYKHKEDVLIIYDVYIETCC